ncbi:MAG: hypothetical protein KAV87_37145, partial [Desulfobacteraceae bacterium]|nr:hypothetical protein [Desulfobacteraceae bacterium]
MDQRLKLTTLGEFTLRLDGIPVKRLASRKVEALLVYLIVTKQVHAREHLATMLWDNRPLGRSLGNLSVVVNSLKKELNQFLEIERSSIAIKASDDVWIDVDEIRGELERFLDLEDAVPNRVLNTVEQALKLYRGSFLQGFHIREARGFDEWASLERERIQHLVLTSWRQLANAYLKNWDQESENRCLRHALEIDPLQEDLHRKLMRNLALSGRYAEAIAQYRECAGILSAELDVEPSLATRHLFDRILARRERPLDNLPSLATTTIGRHDEVDEIKNRLLDPNMRLLTLVGVGGIGKTRLALETLGRLRESFLEGLCFVDLAPLEEPDLVPRAIGRALSMPDGPSTIDGSKAQEDMMERLLEFLEAKDLLLILDNCEHLLDTCVPVTDRLLRQCPGLKVLVTSRERFDLPEEHLFIVEPLTIPDDRNSFEYDIDELRENESIRLFEQRVRAVRKPFALNMHNAHVLVRICQALDGMPLAIELTASRLHSLSLTQIAENLKESIQNIGRDHKGAVPRHQTLEAALDWSYRLLTEEEQQVFRLATIFRGGFDLPALIALTH